MKHYSSIRLLCLARPSFIFDELVSSVVHLYFSSLYAFASLRENNHAKTQRRKAQCYTARSIALSVIAFFISSCAQSNKEYISDMEAPMAEEMAVPAPASPEYTAADFVSSSAARENAADTARRFIRTAELRFKTKDAIRATYAIEDIIVKHGGFVEDTELRSVINYTASGRVSRDSTLESTFYTISNTMRLRVPFRKLDPALKEIAAWAEFMDYRKVSATDVRLSLLRNDLIRRRVARQEERLESAIDGKGEKLNQIVDAEDRLAARREQADNALLSNLELKDKIEYSTITIQLWQDRTAKRVMKADEENIDEYRPGFGIRFADALKVGWRGFVDVVVALANFWALWLIIAGIFAGIKWYKRRKGIGKK